MGKEVCVNLIGLPICVLLKIKQSTGVFIMLTLLFGAVIVVLISFQSVSSVGHCTSLSAVVKTSNVGLCVYVCMFVNVCVYRSLYISAAWLPEEVACSALDRHHNSTGARHLNDATKNFSCATCTCVPWATLQHSYEASQVNFLSNIPASYQASWSEMVACTSYMGFVVWLPERCRAVAKRLASQPSYLPDGTQACHLSDATQNYETFWTRVQGNSTLQLQGFPDRPAEQNYMQRYTNGYKVYSVI